MPDIKKINGKYYDFAPKNESFLQTALELKTLGIRNYYFMLEINDPDVAIIDPFNPHLTSSEIEALMIELESNMWFFSRSVSRVRTTSGVRSLSLHRGTAALFWCFNRHQDGCLCEPRQTFKTTSTLAGPILWAFQLSQNSKFHFFGKDNGNTKKNLSDLRDDIDLLPSWLQFKKYLNDEGKEKKARQSTTKLENNLMHNELEIHPKPNNIFHAQTIGRGGSGNILYYDEIEHTPFFGTILANSSPLYKTAKDNAASIGQAHGRIFTCTPGDLDTPVGAEAAPIIRSMIPWTEKAYDMTDEELETYKSAYKDEYHNSEKESEREVLDVFYIEYQYYQLRKDYAWVQEQYKLSGDKQAIRREILMQRLRGSDKCPISRDDIEYLISNMRRSEKDLIINGKWRFRIYDHGAVFAYGAEQYFDESIPYIVGIDPSAGEGGDNFAVTVLNPYNLKIAAEFKSQYISGPMAVKMLVTLVEDYIPKAVLIPEANSMGKYLIQMINEQTNIGKNLYWSDSRKQLQSYADVRPEDYELKSLATSNKMYGTYLGNNGVRAMMFDLLFEMLERHKDLLTTEYLVNDLCKLIRTPAKRIEAGKGEHDDCVMSYLHALYIYCTGDNLLEFGIDKTLHPIDDPIDENLMEKIQSQYDVDGYFSTKEVTFDTIMEQAVIESENERKLLVDKFSFVHDEAYDSMRDQIHSAGDYSIPASFFEEFNH